MLVWFNQLGCQASNNLAMLERLSDSSHPVFRLKKGYPYSVLVPLPASAHRNV
jgi:hypothetical protein